MLKKTAKKKPAAKKAGRLKGQKGFTLIEFLVVIALAGVLIAGIVVAINKGREASSMSSTGDKLRMVVAGLAEYKVYKGSFPKLDTTSTTWPTALEAYVPAEYRGGGGFPHSYQCDSTAATKSIVIRPPAFSNATEATNVRTKLIDQGFCDSTSPANTAAFEINCTLTQFLGAAGCV